MPLFATLVSSLAAIAASTVGAAFDHPPPIQLEPNTPATGSDIVLDVRPRGGVPTGQRAQSLVLSTASGFAIEPRAVAGRCGPRAAASFRCPEASRIGTGQVEAHANGPLVPDGRLDVAAAVDVFLSRPKQRGDVAGLVLQVKEPTTGKRGSLNGRIVRTLGRAELRFDDIAGAQPSVPGVGIGIDRVLLRAGAGRLIRTPPACAGSWPFKLTISYGDHSDVRDEAVACSAG